MSEFHSELETMGTNGVSTPPYASSSRRTSSKRSISRELSSSPPIPDHVDDQDSKHDQHQVLRDPRRFTPTLHANLVSEILKLRSELDFKHKTIEDLEATLDQAKLEKEEVSEDLLQSEKDRRSLKRQVQQLETGTTAAIEELARDRDDAKQLGNELKVKLDEALEKTKRKDNESDRIHTVWEKERNTWNTERRALERRVHITETRLKAVFSELEAAHEEHAQLYEQNQSIHDDNRSKDGGIGDESDTASQASPARPISSRLSSRNRFSIQSLASAEAFKVNGLSLADELNLDEEDEEVSDAETETEFANSETRVRKIAKTFDEQHRSSMALSSSPIPHNHKTLDREFVQPGKPMAEYLDMGVQAVAPNSMSDVTIPKTYCDTGVQYESNADIFQPAVDSTRKDSKINLFNIPLNRIATPPLLIDRGVSPIDSPSKKSRSSVISSASQTLEEPLSPPATPGVSPPLSPTEFDHISIPNPKIELRTIATQTDFKETEPVTVSPLQLRPTPIIIPSITITSPPSAPSSPREPKLPPGTKNAVSQTSDDLVPMFSVSVQTEPIRIDTRLAKLPPHLHPSAIKSDVSSLLESKRSRSSTKKKTLSNINVNDKSILRSPSPVPEEEKPTKSPTIYAPLPIKQSISSSRSPDGLRKILRSPPISPTFADEADMSEFDDPAGHFIQTEPKVAGFQTPASRSKHRALVSNRPSPVPEEKDEHIPEPFPGYDANIPTASGRSSVDSRAVSSSSKQPTRSSRHRSRTPSNASVGSSSYFSSLSAQGGPPYPVPDRHSSRKLFASRSEGSSSPTPNKMIGSGLFGGSRRRKQEASLAKKESIRKVKSANAIQRPKSRRRHRSPSPPINDYPPLPTDAVASPTLPVTSMTVTASLNSPSDRSSGTVVDAIAATMVGEWMWKYVRRRTSFGVQETPEPAIGRPGSDGSVNVTGNGTRHKRWVWLSPYERSIMWSSKQPQGNAVLGKAGRKLIIQSVLDVRDDTPLPKNHGIIEPFNRSILILTSARALKFTAMSRDRHYQWLTALSFLAHSPLLSNSLENGPIQEEEGEELEPEYQHGIIESSPVTGSVTPGGGGSRASSIKRGGFRDSVRIAKDRASSLTRTSNRDNGGSSALNSEPAYDFSADFYAAPIPPIPSLPRDKSKSRKKGAQGAAEPPSVPRFSSAGREVRYVSAQPPSSISVTANNHSQGQVLRHGRKRSVTGPSKLPKGNIYRDYGTPPALSMALPSPTVDMDDWGRESYGHENNGTIRMEAFINESGTPKQGSGASDPFGEYGF